MRKIKAFIFFLLLFYKSLLIQSQITTIDNRGSTFGIGKFQKDKFGSSKMSFVDENSERSGTKTHYATDTWTDGNLITKTGKLISNLSFRYDVYNDKIEMRSYINPAQINTVTIGKDFYIYVPFVKDNYEREGYMILILDGYAKLLLRKEIKKMPGKGGAYGYSSTEVINTLYYIKIDNAPAQYFDKNIDIFSIIPDKHEDLKTFIKNNKLKLKKRSDLEKLLTYYNNLKKPINQ